jgi:hypothetical protein
VASAAFAQAKSLEPAVFGDPADMATPSTRQDVFGAGWWTPSIVTDADGRGTVLVPMPETTTRWHLMARGVSVDTLAGQGTATITTRHDFFVELKTPRAVREGDELAVLARVHNLTDDDGPAELVLTIADGGRQLGRFREIVELKPQSSADVVFDGVEVPAAGGLDVTVAVTAGARSDAFARHLPVHPWGMEYAAHRGGASSGSETVLLDLPADLPYASRWLTVRVGPSIARDVIDLAIAPSPAGGSVGSELLAAVSGLEYAQKTRADQADRERLARKVRALVSGLVVTQHDDGGWGWVRGADADWAVTSLGYWGLARANQLGFAVHPDTLPKAEQYLRQAYQSAASVDHEQKSIILAALAAGGAAEFELANSLYRHRMQLGSLPLAFAAVTLATLDRREMATELVALLEAKAQQSGDGVRPVCSWSAGGKRHPWLRNDVDTTSIALLALLQTAPHSPCVTGAVNYLMDQRGCFGFPDGQWRGITVAALSDHFGRGQFADDDYRLTIIVNDSGGRRDGRRGPGRVQARGQRHVRLGRHPSRIRRPVPRSDELQLSVRHLTQVPTRAALLPWRDDLRGQHVTGRQHRTWPACPREGRPLVGRRRRLAGDRRAHPDRHDARSRIGPGPDDQPRGA